jgi:hypothetical protein
MRLARIFFASSNFFSGEAGFDDSERLSSEIIPMGILSSDSSSLLFFKI